MARAILFSQTADSAIDVDAEEADHLFNAATQCEEPTPAATHQDWNATSREVAASQSSQQVEPPSQALNSAPAVTASQENSSLHSAAKTGKRGRNPGTAKSPAAKEREEQPLPDVAEVTPPGSAKELSSFSGDTKKAKWQRTNQKTTAGQQNLDESFARTQGSEL